MKSTLISAFLALILALLVIHVNGNAIKRSALLMRRYLNRPTLKLERYLFPYLRRPRTIKGFITHTKYERGIAISTGNKYFNLAILSIMVTRQIYNSDIPIEIFYNGHQDLSEENVKKLSRIPRVIPRDLSRIFNMDILKVSGWSTKPYAMMASYARQVLLLDADVIIMRPLISFFTYPPYEHTGSLFFYDRFILHNNYNYAQWFSETIPFVKQRVFDTPIARGKSSHHQEAGVVLINKRRNFHAILMACILNGPAHVKEVHHMTHGDKEEYWLGSEMVGARYAFSPRKASSIGLVDWGGNGGLDWSFHGRLCGALAHPTDDGRPWWFNDGVLDQKSNKMSGFRQIEHFALGEEGNWDNLCMEGRVSRLNAEEISLIHQIEALYNPHF